MDMLSVNTTTQTVSAPVAVTAPVTPTPISSEVRTDTSHTEATQKTDNVDMVALTGSLNAKAESANLDISFGYNKKIDKVFINVVDKNSGEVIQKLPSEEAMKFAEGMHDLIGKLLDKKG